MKECREAGTSRYNLKHNTSQVGDQVFIDSNFQVNKPQ
jgi:hypothetical protein